MLPFRARTEGIQPFRECILRGDVMYPALNPSMIGVGIAFDECAKLAAQAGFRGISVDLNMAAQEPDAVRRVLEVNKLRPAAWGLPVEFRQADAAFREGTARLPEHAKTAKQVGADRCSTFIMPFSDELTFQQNYELHKTRLRECAEVLAEHGCRLGLEFVGPKTLREGRAHEFINTMEGMLRLCDEIGTGNVGLLLDSFHWFTSHGAKDDIHKLCDALIVDVHINDAVEGRGRDEQIDGERALPGETGVIDLATFLQGLQAVGYKGPVTPEPFSQAVRDMPPEDAIRTTAETVLRVYREAGV
jgi:sugar phosphate isomerase/epimerase